MATLPIVQRKSRVNTISIEIPIQFFTEIEKTPKFNIEIQKTQDSQNNPKQQQHPRFQVIFKL